MVSVIDLKTKIYFGKKAIEFLGPNLKANNVKKIMLVYGGGSIFKNSVYDDIIATLKKYKINYVEYKGVKPNPESDHTYSGALFARKNKVDAIIAAGGGSVTDAAKVMGILANNTNYKDCWSYVLDPSKVKNLSIPIYSVITTAGTASENNAGSVITNTKTTEKRGVMTPSAIPLVAIMDPTYLYTVSAWHTASGIFDCFSHLLEQYYDTPSMEWTKQYIFAHLRTLLKYAETAVKKPKNYEARANIQITTAMALNGLASFASETDWNVHKIEHSISALWNVTHGAGLALVTPTYIKHRSKKDKNFAEQTLELAKEIFNVNTIEKFINKLTSFIKSIGLPLKFIDFPEIKEVTKKDREYLYTHTVKTIKNPVLNVDKKHVNIIKEIIDLIP